MIAAAVTVYTLARTCFGNHGLIFIFDPSCAFVLRANQKLQGTASKAIRRKIARIGPDAKQRCLAARRSELAAAVQLFMFSGARSESREYWVDIQSIPNAAPSWRARSRGIEYESGPGLNPRERSKSLGRFSLAPVKRFARIACATRSVTNMNFGSGQTIKKSLPSHCEQSIRCCGLLQPE